MPKTETQTDRELLQRAYDNLNAFSARIERHGIEVCKPEQKVFEELDLEINERLHTPLIRIPMHDIVAKMQRMQKLAQARDLVYEARSDASLDIEEVRRVDQTLAEMIRTLAASFTTLD